MVQSFKTFLTEALLEVDRADIDKLFAPLKKPLKEMQGAWEGYDPKNPEATMVRIREVSYRYWTSNRPTPLATISSGQLKSKICREAHAINPITFYIYFAAMEGNLYDATKGYVSIGIPESVLRPMLGRLDVLDGLHISLIRNEISDVRVKSTIRHEMSHWLDDSLHNRHIRNISLVSSEIFKTNPDKARAYFKKTISQGQDDVYMGGIEVTALVNQIDELRRRLKKSEWDKLTWYDVIMAIPSLQTLNASLGAKWRQKMFSRLARENLIGKNFRNRLY